MWTRTGPTYRAQLAKHDVAYPKIELRLYATETEARQVQGGGIGEALFESSMAASSIPNA